MCEKAHSVNYEKYIFGASGYNGNNPVLSEVQQSTTQLCPVGLIKSFLGALAKLVQVLTHVYPLPFLNPSQFRILAVDDYVASDLLRTEGNTTPRGERRA